MIKRIFRSILAVALIVFIASLILIMGALYGYFSEIQHDQLKMQTQLAAQGMNNEGISYFDGFETEDYRITWIASDGTVLYDNRLNEKEMESHHLEREEIKEALKEGYGESRRYSSTLMERSLYCAQLLNDGTVLRLSMAQSTVTTLAFGMTLPICLAIVVAVVVSMLLANHLSKKIVKPLNSINLDEPLSNNEYDELSPLLHRLDSQQRQLKHQSYELQGKKEELEAVTGNMNEGMIFLNKKGTILSINPSAAKLLDADFNSVGENILTVSRSLDLQSVLVRAMNGERAEKIIDINDGRYQLDVSPVISDGSVSGVVLLLFDVTEKENAEQMRREFTANVSHELKTPLHSISGYAELLKSGMVMNEHIEPFAGKIYAEAQRMVRLVEDIINLSHLDEGADDMKREDVDLYVIAQNTIRSLESEAKLASVSFELTGYSAMVNGIPQLLTGIVYNLCDNAIKYNKENGKVSIDVRTEDSAVVLSVSDTGIGVPPEHQNRIFERFYRVDKSHSKEVGGTGLGLSIVKHAAKIHDAKIELSSVVNEGTTVTVRFVKHGNDLHSND